MSAEDLLCDEDMLDSDPEDVPDDSLRGTELLQIQLRARMEQIFRSLGVRELPRTASPPRRRTSSASLDSLAEDVADSDVVVPEEYAAEVVLGADGESVQKLTDLRLPLSPQPAGKSFIASRQDGGTSTVESPRQSGNFNNELLSGLDSSTCSLASFDGTPPHEPVASVKVHVRPVSDNRVVIKYPKYRHRSSPTSEYVHLDVTFPYGASDEVVDSYVRNSVARLIRDSAASDVPLSMNVVRDDAATREDDRGGVLAVSSVTQHRHRSNAHQSAVNVVSVVQNLLMCVTQECICKPAALHFSKGGLTLAPEPFINPARQSGEC